MIKYLGVENNLYFSYFLEIPTIFLKGTQNKKKKKKKKKLKKKKKKKKKIKKKKKKERYSEQTKLLTLKMA